MTDAQNPAKPNIIFIMADDMGYGDVGCFNPESKIPTPNLDRLAEQGARFTDAHAPSAVCTPTRYGVLTGRYCWRTPLKDNVLYSYEPPLIDDGRMTVASFLKQQGYATACIGKWHLGLGYSAKEGTDYNFDRPLPWPGGTPPLEEEINIDFHAELTGCPLDVGFDYAFYTSGCSTAQPPYAFIRNRQFVNPNLVRKTGKDWHAPRGGMAEPDWRHEDTDPTFMGEAVGWLEQRKAQTPFFLYLPLSAPHAPWLAPEFCKGVSDAGELGDMNVLVDWCVGQITETLDRLGLSDNTLLIFTSDNGPRIGLNGHESSWKYRGSKSHIWEGGHRIPFIARWPGKIEPGTTNDNLICLTDLLATAADLHNQTLPANAGEDSISMLPLLTGGTEPVRDEVISHSCFGAFSLRKGPWKAVYGTKGSGGWVAPKDEYPLPDSPGQLYNIETDPFETQDLWDAKPDVVARLAAVLDRYKAEGRSVPLP